MSDSHTAERNQNVRNVIITVSNLYLPNGLVTSTCNLADALIARGYKVEFYLQWGADPRFREKYHIRSIIPGIKFTHYMKGYESSNPLIKPVRRAIGFVLHPYYKIRLRRLFNRYPRQQTVLIGSALESYNLLSSLLGKTKNRTVFQLHMSHHGLTPENFQELEKAIKTCKSYSVLATEDGRKLEEEIGGTSYYIPNIVDTLYSTDTQLEKVQKIVYAGRLTPEKQVDHIIEAFQQIQHSTWTLHIYGSGPEEQKLRRLIGDNPRISLHPPVDDIAKIYADAAINVLSSRIEGFGMVIVEAGQYRVPTVSYDMAPGVRNAIGDGGILVPAQDKKALKQTLETLMKDESQRQLLAEKAHHHSQQFRPDNVIKRWEEVFESLAFEDKKLK